MNLLRKDTGPPSKGISIKDYAGIVFRHSQADVLGAGFKVLVSGVYIGVIWNSGKDNVNHHNGFSRV